MGNLSDVQIDPNAEPENNYGPIPAGEYEAKIQNSERKDTKKGDGWYLNLEFVVTGPTHAGRKIFEKLNLSNPSSKAVEIAKGTLSKICRTVGVLSPQDSAELHDKPMRIKVAIEQSQDYDPQNKITDYKPMSATPGAPSSLPERKPPTVKQAMKKIDAALEPVAAADDVPF